jgi:two-component system, response regulator YesN
VLVVDPDEMLAQALALLSTPYEIVSATTAETGLAILQRRPVDLVLLEQRLPDCPGVELLCRLRERWPCLPAIMVTAYGSEEICAAAFKQGASDYLIKPCTRGRVLAAIESAVGAAAEASHQQVRRSQSSGPAPRPASPSTPNISPPARVVPSEAELGVDTSDASLLAVERAVRFIQEHYWERVPLATVAREVGTSPFVLSRRFRAALGVPFRRYYLQLRVEKAKTLMRSRQYSVTQVAQMVGFGDLPRFDKVFKHLAGTTPSSYRALNRMARGEAVSVQETTALSQETTSLALLTE